MFYFIQEKAFIKRFFDDTVVFFPFIAFPSVLPPSKEEERKRERDDQKRKKMKNPKYDGGDFVFYFWSSPSLFF